MQWNSISVGEAWRGLEEESCSSSSPVKDVNLIIKNTIRTSAVENNRG